jgi:hypothetical protein
MSATGTEHCASSQDLPRLRRRLSLGQAGPDDRTEAARRKSASGACGHSELTTSPGPFACNVGGVQRALITAMLVGVSFAGTGSSAIAGMLDIASTKAFLADETHFLRAVAGKQPL